MKVDSLSNLDVTGKVLVVGDCATNHIERFLPFDNVISRQIQSGLGCEDELESLKNVEAIFLFVSWANAISVIEDEATIQKRIESHLKIINSLCTLNIPFLMIDRQGFLDRFASPEFLNGRESVPYPQALREGWRPQNQLSQFKRRQRYSSEVCKVLDHNNNYFDLMEYVGVSTYRHESGECKNNIINIAPWHYDVDSYNYAATVFDEYIKSGSVSELIKSWEHGVLELKTVRV